MSHKETVMSRTVDTLPPAERDELLPFEGYFNCESHCRMRVYQTTDGTPMIVLTEVEDNPGTSITNRAERVQYLAWRRIGSPAAGAYFVEHCPGYPNPRDAVLDGEHLDWVQFDEALDGSSEASEAQRRQRKPVLMPLVVNGSNVGMEFRHPEWRRLPREEFDRLLGEGCRQG
jgi:hypothetical protein